MSTPTIQVFLCSLRLGLSSFGGPIAHLGYFRQEYVEKRKWLDESRFADLVALCQFLPGPASSQVGMAVGWSRAGFWGAVAAWAGFTLPSALLMVVFAILATVLPTSAAKWFQGLSLVAVAVVGQAVFSMAKSILVNKRSVAVALVTIFLLGIFPSGLTPLFAIGGAAVAGVLWFRNPKETPIGKAHQERIPFLVWLIPLAVFGLLLVGLPLLKSLYPGPITALFDSFYRVGALVFGGGHVVLPLLQSELKSFPGISSSDFFSGYGWAQAVPGPMFTISGYLGYLVDGWLGALTALLAMFLPSLLLVSASLPVWELLRQNAFLRSGLAAVNASVVGLLAFALYTPLWTTAIKTPVSFCFSTLLFGLLVIWKIPSWAVVLLGLLMGVVSHVILFP